MEDQLEKSEIIKSESNPQSLIQIAIEKGASIESLEKLLSLQERWEKSQAEKAFNLAMANFQKVCPVIGKNNTVKDKTGKERYKFADIGEIVSTVKSFIAENNLFYDFTTQDLPDFMSVTCTVTHSAGHSKATTFKVPIGKEDYMTDVQKYGARMTFAKRYAFCNAFGITTGEEDNDSEGEDTFSDSVKESINKVTTEDALKEIWNDKKAMQNNKEFIQAIKDARKRIKKGATNE